MHYCCRNKSTIFFSHFSLLPTTEMKRKHYSLAEAFGSHCRENHNSPQGLYLILDIIRLIIYTVYIIKCAKNKLNEISCPALSPSPSTASQAFAYPISPPFQNLAESMEKEPHTFEEEVSDTITDEDEIEIRNECRNFTTDFNVTFISYARGCKILRYVHAGSDSWKYFHWSSMLTYHWYVRVSKTRQAQAARC